MSESKRDHTPGPWVVKKYDDDTYGVRQDPSAPSVALTNDEGQIQDILPCGFSICNMVENDEATIANANLIASAPALQAENARLRTELTRLKDLLKDSVVIVPSYAVNLLRRKPNGKE